MKSILVTSFLFLQFFLSCTNADNITPSENEEDAARNFIRSVLDAEFDKAKTFIVPDSTNNEFLAVTERNFTERMNRTDKMGYKAASIQIHEVKKIDDSTSVVLYSNSFKKQKDSVKVVLQNNAWLVDLKYSFPPNALVQ